MVKVMQWNCRSINTSVKLLSDYAVRKKIDLISLQEVWTPKDLGVLKKKSQYRTHIILRNEDGRGIHCGVAIIHKPSMKVLPRKKLQTNYLEACWADTYIDGENILIGSIYITPDAEEDLIKLDKWLEQAKERKNILLAGDFNSRNLLWENWYNHQPTRSTAWKMGNTLIEILCKHGFYIINNGQCTRTIDEQKSSPDITAIRGYKGKVSWYVDHNVYLSSVHDPIIISIGEKPTV